jgi:hypothetical protein
MMAEARIAARTQANAISTAAKCSGTMTKCLVCLLIEVLLGFEEWCCDLWVDLKSSYQGSADTIAGCKVLFS